MKKDSALTLTEPMCYVLLALEQQTCGVDIVKKVRELSADRMIVGPGTVFRLLDRFLAGGLIEDTKSAGVVRSFRITNKGFDLLRQEMQQQPLFAADANCYWRDFNEKPE